MLALAGCATAPVDVAPPNVVELTAVAERSVFPVEAAGFTRERVLIYGPNHRNYSVTYHRSDGFAQTVVFFVYETGAAPATQFRAERAGMEQAHADASLLAESRGPVERGGQRYAGYTADFEYEDIFDRRVQPVHARLRLLAGPGGFLKMRSTAPVAQRESAMAGARQLLATVDWPVCLAEPTEQAGCVGKRAREASGTR
ncbi:MAG: hypothetical protein CMN28_11600 [Salinisphaeraceae bacterium]|nr:hypothetical protein [Salinisphaeraceae bacterium]